MWAAVPAAAVADVVAGEGIRTTSARGGADAIGSRSHPFWWDWIREIPLLQRLKLLQPAAHHPALDAEITERIEAAGQHAGVFAGELLAEPEQSPQHIGGEQVVGVVRRCWG